jgi:hypothetical protein
MSLSEVLWLMCAKTIHPANMPLLDLPDSHPARVALNAHLEARIECVGREIRWPNMSEDPVEQRWFSQIDQRILTFSGFTYAFISFDLVLDGWLLNSTVPDACEIEFLSRVGRLRSLLAECEHAANEARNYRVIPLIEKVRRFFNAYEESIYTRVGSTGSK